MGKLSGKVALVTGGSRGIGAAIAKRLAADGAAVAITYASSKPKAEEFVAEIEAAGGRALAIQADSADKEAVKRSIDETFNKFGSLDILVNNAAIASMADIAEFSGDEFERMLSINVRSVFYATQEAVKRMGKGGRVIHIGSVNSERVPFAGASVYALTKGAIAGFTHGLAHDLAPRGITVNNIQPGPIDTDMNPADGPMAELMRSMLAVKRHGHGSEVASLVAHLAGPDADFITGAGFKIDGGFMA